MNLEDFVEVYPHRLAGPNAAGWLNGKCAAHDDKAPPFGVKAGESGLVVKCQAGCTVDAIAAALGLEVRDLFFEHDSPRETRARVERLRLEAEYLYPDGDGSVRLLKRRLRRPDGGKTFDWLHRNGSETWESGKGAYPRRLYNLPAVLQAVRDGRPVLLVEGEKDADTAAELGWTATTTPEASGIDEEILAPIHEADVVIVGDNDGPGRAYVLAAAKLLPRARVLPLPGVERKGDLTDWAAKQVDPAGALRRLVGDLGAETKPVADAGDPIAAAGFLTLPEAVALNIPRSPRSLGVQAVDRLLAGGLAEGEALTAGGGPGSGKTTFLCRAASVLAGAETALLVVAHDEFFSRVARKIATGFNESYAELTAEYPPVLERLGRKVHERGAFLVLDDARNGRPLDVIVNAFTELVPAGRAVYVLIDHFHAVELSTFEDRDTDTQRVEKVSSFIASLTRRGWAVITLSEITKAALNPATVREAPLAAFAGSRKIASRADAAIVMVPDEKAPRQIHLIAAKSRFGPRASALVELDPTTWTFATIDQNEVEAAEKAEAETRQAEGDARDEAAVLQALRLRVAAGKTSSRTDLIDAVSIRQFRARKAIVRLLTADVLREDEAPARASGGRRGSLLTEVSR